MSNSLDRLIRLARKTGDRLIIHDPGEERDIVIMDLDQYEMLVEAKNDLEEYIDDFESYNHQNNRFSSHPEKEQAHFSESIAEFSQQEEMSPAVSPEEPEHISYPMPEPEPPAVKSVQPVGNWTPAVSLLEEKYRVLTGHGASATPAPKDQEPRRVPMVSHEADEQEFDEDDDEPVFLEEPV